MHMKNFIFLNGKFAISQEPIPCCIATSRTCVFQTKLTDSFSQRRLCLVLINLFGEQIETLYFSMSRVIYPPESVYNLLPREEDHPHKPPR